MTFAQLKQEMIGRGFDYLDDGGTGVAKVGRWINRGYIWLATLELWPFRETSSDGEAPLEITDLGQIEAVRLASDGTRYWHIPRDQFTTEDLNTTGTPVFYYVEDGTTVKLYPYAESEIIVNYWAKPFELNLDTDTPVVPSEYQGLIVDAAAVWAYRDRDDYDQANALRQSIELDLQNMRANLLTAGEPGYVIQFSDPAYS